MPGRVNKGPSAKDKAICSLAIAIDRMLKAGFTWTEILSAVCAPREADKDTTFKKK
jgi:hypothetical protein